MSETKASWSAPQVDHRCHSGRTVQEAEPVSWRIHHRACWRSRGRSQIPDVQASASATGESPRVLLPPRAAWQGPMDESNPAQDVNRAQVRAAKAEAERPRSAVTVGPGSDAAATPRSAAGSSEPGASPSLPCHHPPESPPDAAGGSACWAAWQACWAAPLASADARSASAAEESPSAGGPSASVAGPPASPDAPQASPAGRHRRQRGPSRACRRPHRAGRRPSR